jgi:tRNA A58 N-methylase Trm61
MAESGLECASEGDWVVLSGSDKQQHLVPIGAKKTYKVGRTQVVLKPLVGAPYGAVFELVNGALVRAEGELVFSKADEYSADGTSHAVL